MIKILDCTLRDGGYYTNWDFDKDLVDEYIYTMNDLPIDYIEIGYRSPSQNQYLGEYFYTPIETLERIRKQLNPSIKIAIMFNTKDVEDVNELQNLLLHCEDKIDMVRFAVSSKNIYKAVQFAKRVKELGFEVALNLMYLSQKDTDEIINEVNFILDYVENIDFIYLVDSYGACLPSEIKDKFNAIKEVHPDLALGFHSHDNIQLAYANSLEAINAGVNVIDATITGMGRGAGNLSTELICSYKAAEDNIELDYTNLVELLEKFNDMKVEYGWGASLPYMISGFNKLPQGEVMDLISLKRFSTNKIVRIIENKIHNEVSKSYARDVVDLSNIKYKYKDYDFALIVGGGLSVTKHIDGLKTLKDKFNILFIHSTTKHLDLFTDVGFTNLVCLPGDEIRKMKSINSNNQSLIFVISNDAEIDKHLLNSNFYAIDLISNEPFANKVFTKDAPLYISLKVTDTLNINNFYLIGFDGYDIETKSNKILKEENQAIIDMYLKLDKRLVSLTPTKYNIDIKSIYSLIVHGE